MAFRVQQANFSKGEIAEELVARVDVSSYSTALRRAENVVILKYGGVTKRSGTRLVSEVYLDEGVRLIPFQFSLTQTYALEMGQGYMRAAAAGGMVIEEKLTIISITRGTTTIVEVVYHDFSVGDQAYFSGVKGCEDLNGKIGRVFSVTDASHFVIDLDTSEYDAFTSDTGGITRTGLPIPPPAHPVVPPVIVIPDPPDLSGYGLYGSGLYGRYRGIDYL